MTSIVGIKCEDGIVIAADSRATLGTLGDKTTVQDVSKLEIPAEGVIIGISGFVGLGQKIVRTLDNNIWNKVKGKGTDHLMARKIIRDKMWIQVEPELEAAEKSAKVIGPRLAMASSTCDTLIAAPIENVPVLLQYDHQCASEEVDKQIPFVSIGSGKIYSDPFLAFLKKDIWVDEIPKNIQQATLSAIWTLDYVIGRDPTGGVGGNVQVATLTNDGNKWNAKMMSEHLISEHRQFYTEGVIGLKEYWNPD